MVIENSFKKIFSRLCPFEDVTMVGLSPDDVDQFLQVNIILYPFIYS